LISNSAFIDRKVKFHISPKSNVAIKILRSHLGSLLAQQFRGKPLSESQSLWFEMALMVLGKAKIEATEGQEHLPMVVIN
jgi:ATP-dependent RNA helicase DHX29